MSAEGTRDSGILVIDDIHGELQNTALQNAAFHDAAEDRIPDIDSYESIHDLTRAYPELIAHQEMYKDQYWSMVLDRRVGPRERSDARRFIDAPDRQVAGERRTDEARRRKNRRANKAARAARRAGRR